MGASQSLPPTLNEVIPLLTWSRGTNTSIFLSYYQHDQKFWLLPKGEQIKKGFVPMLETWTVEIVNPCGANWFGISGTSGSDISLNKNYANSTSAYDQQRTIDSINDLATYLLGDPNNWGIPNSPAAPMEYGCIIAYNLARIIQFDPNYSVPDKINNALHMYMNAIDETHRHTHHFIQLLSTGPLDYEREQSYQEAINRVKKNPGRCYKPIQYSMSDPLQEVVEKFSSRDRIQYIDVENRIRKHFGLCPINAKYLMNCKQYGGSMLHSLAIAHMGQPIKKKTALFRLENMHLRDKLFTAAIWRRFGIATVGRDFWRSPSSKAIADKVQRCLPSLEAAKQLVFAIQAKSLPRLTDIDKAIIANPISLIIASTVCKGADVVHEHFEGAERDLIGPIEIGCSDPRNTKCLNVIIFPSRNMAHQAHAQVLSQITGVDYTRASVLPQPLDDVHIKPYWEPGDNTWFR